MSRFERHRIEPGRRGRVVPQPLGRHLAGNRASPGHRGVRVADLVGELGLAQSTVSAHVACLRDCQLVEGRPQGRQVFYSLARPELMDLLVAAERLLAAIGAVILGEVGEAAALAFLFSISEGLEEYSFARSRRGLRALLSLAPDQA